MIPHTAPDATLINSSIYSYGCVRNITRDAAKAGEGVFSCFCQPILHWINNPVMAKNA